MKTAIGSYQKLFLAPNFFQNMCTPWKDALVVKFLGKNLDTTQ
jgi:hypothetical protein